MRYLLIGWLYFFLTSAWAGECADTLPIIAKPIQFQSERIALTRAYQREHYGIESDSIQIEPKIIVIHWTGLSTLKESFDYFEPERLVKERRDLPGELNVSAHFLVDRDGTIYQLMPDDWMARHVIGLNHFAIGVENVGGVEDKADLTSEQLKANRYLVCYLKNKYPTIAFVIGHYEYEEFKNTPYWLEKDTHYFTQKSDPGVTFMQEITDASVATG